MAELRESGQYTIAYNKLLGELKSYDLTREDFDNYIYLLLDAIKADIEQTGTIPGYSYLINVNLPLLYEFNGTRYLEVLCGFEPIPEYVEDLTITNVPEDIDTVSMDNYLKKNIHPSILLPKSGSARMNLISGDYDVNVSWQEYFLE